MSWYAAFAVPHDCERCACCRGNTCLLSSASLRLCLLLRPSAARYQGHLHKVVLCIWHEHAGVQVSAHAFCAYVAHRGPAPSIWPTLKAICAFFQVAISDVDAAVLKAQPVSPSLGPPKGAMAVGSARSSTDGASGRMSQVRCPGRALCFCRFVLHACWFFC